MTQFNTSGRFFSLIQYLSVHLSGSEATSFADFTGRETGNTSNMR